MGVDRVGLPGTASELASTAVDRSWCASRPLWPGRWPHFTAPPSRRTPSRAPPRSHVRRPTTIPPLSSAKRNDFYDDGEDEPAAGHSDDSPPRRATAPRLGPGNTASAPVATLRPSDPTPIEPDPAPELAPHQVSSSGPDGRLKPLVKRGSCARTGTVGHELDTVCVSDLCRFAFCRFPDGQEPLARVASDKGFCLVAPTGFEPALPP